MYNGFKTIERSYIMMNCKELLRIVNPPTWTIFFSINPKLCRSFKSIDIEHNMRILAINMIVDGEY